MQMSELSMMYALDRLGLSLDGEVRMGFNNVTVSARAVTPEGSPVWVRVSRVPQPPLWPRAHAIKEAQVLVNRVPMPRVIDECEWEQWDDDLEKMGHARALVFEWVDGSPVFPEPTADTAPDVSDVWWRQLRDVHDAITTAEWAGPGRSEKHFARRVTRHLPDAPGLTHIPWVPQHGDFHWANLVSPLTVVDWEGFSLAPAGLDAATLLTYSLSHPPTAERVSTIFSDVLSGDLGRCVQIYACVDVMTAVEAGFHPHLEQPIREHMRFLLS
ncbi:hypothetical protein F4561_005087 [Lipingzhangella halophila]|uniref:Aminoglycoside phosphotransferase domain-containing protein n=1 Tax=Lipingzhangella halophila TaxID=1783352 RepID=A0A7W7RM24_9ACTN|nr:phosphotransferase [Lipingzhangella halophila]MBB4934267.1 hypothetical protein [Lipingzhangella halophila]